MAVADQVQIHQNLRDETWQIFLVGTIGAIALFSFHAYESALAGMAAVTTVAAVVLGFCLRPRTDVFYLRTTVRVPDPEFAVAVEHDQVAARVELARLWLRFIATFASVAFLLITYANGTTWKISLIDSSLVDLLGVGPYPVLFFFRFLVIAVFVLMMAWISERWVFRDASGCNADYLHRYKRRIMYSFKDRGGGYYGGQGFAFGATRSPRLRTIVLYRTSRPQVNKLALCCLFHRPVIVGRGVTDLDKATVANSAQVQPVSNAQNRSAESMSWDFSPTSAAEYITNSPVIP
jgi:hypothetical protein